MTASLASIFASVDLRGKFSVFFACGCINMRVRESKNGLGYTEERKSTESARSY